jgi:uncharacterized protein
MSVLTRGIVLLVRGYQQVARALLPRACRFEPSCSEYYRQALLSVGFLRATGLGIRRIGRCHPWHPGGYDPPPVDHSQRRDKPRI